MIYRNLGGTEISIPVIGQGTTGTGPEGSANPERIQLREAILREGIERGMTLLDTGEHYEDGRAEELVGRVTRGIRHRVVISSKFRPDHNGRDSVLRAAEGSLRRLRTDTIDLYQIQWPNPAIPLAETMEALMKLHEQGKIRCAGVCNFTAAQLAEARALSRGTLAALQTEYNLCNRQAEAELLPLCREQGISFLAYSPFSQGRQSFSHEEKSLLDRLARKYEATPWQIILGWIIAHPSTTVITRSMSFEHTRDNAAAADLRLSPEDLEEISARFLREPVYVDTARINLLHGETPEPSWIYRTLEDAVQNRLSMKPGPVELAHEIQTRGLLKPIEVKPARDGSGRYDYDLIHGQMRYWGWILAHGPERPIPANVLRGERL